MELRIEPERFELILGVCPDAVRTGFIPAKIKWADEGEIKNSLTKDISFDATRAYGKTLIKVKDFQDINFSEGMNVYITFASKIEDFPDKETALLSDRLRKEGFLSDFKIKGYRSGGYVLDKIDAKKILGYEAKDKLIYNLVRKGKGEKAKDLANVSEEKIKKTNTELEAHRMNYIEVLENGENIDVKFRVFLCDSDEEDNFNMKRFEKFLSEFKEKFKIEEREGYLSKDGEEKKSKIFVFNRDENILKDLLRFKSKDEALIEGFKLELEKGRGGYGR
ncbi:MAG: hypothetical protein M1467_04315 [Deltaproteobacteria bacterium]|nr:hypothetical protein [Deltaproteobacteria bacterium]